MAPCRVAIYFGRARLSRAVTFSPYRGGRLCPKRNFIPCLLLNLLRASLVPRLAQLQNAPDELRRIRYLLARQLELSQTRPPGKFRVKYCRIEIAIENLAD